MRHTDFADAEAAWEARRWREAGMDREAGPVERLMQTPEFDPANPQNVLDMLALMPAKDERHFALLLSRASADLPGTPQGDEAAQALGAWLIAQSTSHQERLAEKYLEDLR